MTTATYSDAFTRPQFKPGDTLPNGRIVVAIRLMEPKGPAMAGSLFAVLAVGFEEYVVWTLVETRVPGGDPQPPYCIDGDYIDNFDAACRNFRRRTR